MIGDAEQVRAPGWWLLRLGRALRDRRKQLDAWWKYYSGEPPLPQGPAKASEAYADFQRKARTNLCGNAVDASVFRLEATGVADSAGKPDDEAWRWWQANRLDARQKRVYRLALARSVAYVIAGPHPRDQRVPLITVEHPHEVIVVDDPETGDRAAAVKAWHDDISGHDIAKETDHPGPSGNVMLATCRRPPPFLAALTDLAQPRRTRSHHPNGQWR